MNCRDDRNAKRLAEPAPLLGGGMPMVAPHDALASLPRSLAFISRYFALKQGVLAKIAPLARNLRFGFGGMEGASDR